MASCKLQASMPEVTMRQLEDLCKQFGFTKSVVVAMAIRDMYERQKGERKADK